MRERMQNSGCGPMSLATAMIVLVVACGISEVGKPDVREEDEQQGIGSPFRSVCCVSGFEYPPGCDWNDETQTLEARCSLVVFADGVPEIKVPVGDGYQVSRDHDMHRVLNGRLYTFYSKDGQTVIKRNGTPLFRYEADEVLVDLAEKDEDVYILAQRRAGGGFSFRRNGEVLVERLSGETFGRFWDDGGCLGFAFMQPVALADAVEYRHYVVCDGNVVAVQNDGSLERIWDLWSCKGSTYILASLRGTGEVFLIRDGLRKKIVIPDSAEMLSCRLFPADSLMGVECMYEYMDGTCESGIWVDGSEYIRFQAGRSIQGLIYEDGNAYCILNPEEDEGIIFDAGELERMPGGYFCINDRVLAVHDGSFHVAMSSRDGGRPVIWHDGQMDTLRLNGCVSSITFTGTDADIIPR